MLINLARIGIVAVCGIVVIARALNWLLDWKEAIDDAGINFGR